MKRIISLFLLTSFLLVACDQAQTENSSETIAESSEIVTESSEVSEEKKVWTEVEENGDTKITREYRDGENDYTVTEETFLDNGVIGNKKISNFKNDLLADMETFEYSETGDIVKRAKMVFDEGENAVEIDLENVVGNYLYKCKAKLDKDGALYDGVIEINDSENSITAKGTRTRKDFNGHDCHVAELEVFADGVTAYYETYALGVGSETYIYKEILSADHNPIFSYESFNEGESNKKVSKVYGDVSAIEIYYSAPDVIESKYVYTKLDGKAIAEAVRTQNGIEITSIGSGYNTNNIVAKINEIQAAIKELQDGMISNIIFW